MLPNEYQLTEDEQGMLLPIIETVENLQKDAQAILRSIIRLRKLEGNWNLQGNKIVRVPNGNGSGDAGFKSAAENAVNKVL